jgi:hypothetical protein
MAGQALALAPFSRTAYLNSRETRPRFGPEPLVRSRSKNGVASLAFGTAVSTLRPSPASVVAPPARRVSLALGLALGLAVVLLLAALLLWSRYGTAVFFEMIAAGIAACF